MPPNASAPASHSGLSGMEAAARLKAEGFNELPSQGEACNELPSQGEA